MSCVNCKAALWCNVAFHVLTTTPDGPVCRAASPELQRQLTLSSWGRCRGGAKRSSKQFFLSSVAHKFRFSDGSQKTKVSKDHQRCKAKLGEGHVLPSVIQRRLVLRPAEDQTGKRAPTLFILRRRCTAP